MQKAELYYYERDGHPAGPVAADQLLASGVRATTQVWQEGLADWVPAASLPALAPLFVSPLPPPLPVAAAVPAVPAFVPVGASAPTVPALESEPDAPSRLAFSTETSRHNWWHYLIRALAALLLFILARACGTLIGHAISIAEPPPTQVAIASITPTR